MAARTIITSSANTRLKSLRRLERRGRRAAEHAFLVEGGRQLRAALDAGAKVREVFVAPELFLGAHDEELVALVELGGARVFELGADAFYSISADARVDGLAALVERWSTSLTGLRVGETPFLVVADGIERPGNLGTILRTAAGAGVDAVLVSDSRIDVFGRGTVGGSVGAIFRVPVATTSAEAAAMWLREREVRIMVAAPDASLDYALAEYAGPLAIVVGSERHGVASTWLEHGHETVSIPMATGTDSLNVAVATGVVLFQAARARGYSTATNRPSR